MMLAVKHLDPVVGVDIHFIITPPGAVVPIPHPHIGIVFDPFDYLPWIGATVKVNGLPRAQAGTGGRTLPPHFPIGGVFAKPPGNENETFMGSSTVVVEDEPFTYMTLPVLSCQDIGMPSPPRKKGPGAKTLLLPTSIALSIPAGPPVFVGGPPTISMSGLEMKLAIGGLLKGLKKLRKVQKASRKMKALSDRIHRMADKAMDKLKVGKRARDRVHKAICTLTGHPVDVATGRVVTEAVDWELPGPIPLEFRRHYSSSLSWRDSVVGWGWSHSLDLVVWEEEGQVVFRAEDGREIEFDVRHFPKQHMPEGQEVFEPASRLTLRRVGKVRWEVESAEGLMHELRLVAGEMQPGMCRVVRTCNRVGHAIYYEYDARGRLEWVVDSARRRLRFEHDERGRLVRTWLPHPMQPELVSYNRYGYSEAGDLVEAWDPLGHATRYEYEEHLLDRERDRTGLSFYFEYDGNGPGAWCVRTWGDGGIHDHRLVYDKDRSVTEVTNSLGHTTAYYSDGRGVVVREVDPLGYEWRREYDGALRLVAEVDPLGNATRYEYDRRGNCIQEVRADGSRLTWEYDAQNHICKAQDACGGLWVWTHDSRGLLRQVKDPLGGVESYEYDARGLLRAAIAPDGSRLEMEHDAACNLRTLRLPGSHSYSCEYDRLGRIIAIHDTGGNTERRYHDLEGRLVRRDDPGGFTLQLEYDDEGGLLRQHDPYGTLLYTYTGYHQLASQEHAGQRSLLRYDTEGRLVEVQNALGECHRLRLDPRGLVLEESSFDGATTLYEWDPGGRLTKITQPGGSSSESKYDALGRLVEVRYSDGNWKRFSYREDGELVEALTQETSVHFERDALGRVTLERQGEEWISTRYDITGDRAVLESSLGARFTFSRNRAGDVDTIAVDRSDAAWRVRFMRDSTGLESSRLLPGGIVTQWTRNAQGRPRQLQVRCGNNLLLSRAWEWSGPYRITAITEAGEGRRTFLYDSQGQLMAEQGSGAAPQYLVPDAAGNVYRTPERRDRRYGSGGILLESEGVQFEHDQNGRLVTKLLADGQRWRYVYNDADRLSEVEDPAGERVLLTYDAFGRRVRKRTSRGVTDYIWDGDVVLHEVDDRRSAVTWLFTPDSFEPLARLDETGCYGIVSDYLGVPQMMFDADGELVWKGGVDVHGQLHVNLERVSCPWRWPGQYADVETGLSYNRFRYYDPANNRYTIPDPLGLAGGLSRYSYVPDPLLWIDPLGLIFGIYEFPEGNGWYVGSSIDTQRRLGEHIRDKRLADRALATEKFVDVYGAKGRDAKRLLRLAEQEAIQKAKWTKQLTNVNRAVAKKKMDFYKELRKWYRGGQKGKKPSCK